MITETRTPEPRRTTRQRNIQRIGLFSESFQPVQNGVTTSVLTLLNGLRSRGHRVWAFAPRHAEQREPETDVLRFPSFVTAFNPGYPLAYPFVPRLTLISRFAKLDLHIVHTHTPFVLGLTGANLALSRGIPLVSTFHTLYTRYGHYVPFLPEAVTQGLLEHYLPWYYNRCKLVICPSGVAAEALTEIGVDRPIVVIPTGIPLPPASAVGPDSRRAVRESLGVSDGAPILLYAGRLAREKQVPWLFEVFVRVLARSPQARLVLAGGGPDTVELRDTANRMRLGDRVVFLGPMPRNRIDALYAGADVFCFPSPSETQGLVIGEARAAGLPCVVIDAGGAPETVAHGVDGFRVPQGDVEGFAACVLNILRDSDLRWKLHVNALQNARRFTPDSMVNQVLDVYDRARGEPGPRTQHGPEEVSFRAGWEKVGLTDRS